MNALLARDIENNSVRYVAIFAISQPSVPVPRVAEAAAPGRCREEISGDSGNSCTHSGAN
jgi:hypothetical protein